MIEPILLTAANVLTFKGQCRLTNASGFFFEREERLFLVTSRHVLMDAPGKHFPDRIEIELHVNPRNLAESTGFSIPLYREGVAIWRQASDAAGQGDIAFISSSSESPRPKSSSTFRQEGANDRSWLAKQAF